MATIAEALNVKRSFLKDEGIVYHIESQLKTIFQSFKGLRRFRQFATNDLFRLYAKLLYLSSTFLMGSQTLGEEFGFVIPISRHSNFKAILHNFPSVISRFLYIFTSVIVPYLFKHPPATAFLQFKKILELGEKLCELWASFLMPFHSALFFLGSSAKSNYEFLRLALGLKYLSTANSEKASSDGSEILGILSFSYGVLNLWQRWRPFSRKCKELIQIASTATISVMESKNNDNEGEDGDGECELFERCSLCMGKRKFSTITNCGHLFCYYCIQEWALSKNECPLCRRLLERNRFYRNLI